MDGPVRTESQMETDIIAAFEGSNNALRDSITGDVEVFLNVVRIERVRTPTFSCAPGVRPNAIQQ